MDGYLLVDKPAGISSFGVVARVRRILSEQAGRKIKVGHTGTLDPFATGLMILVIGSYTKKASQFSKMDKTYEATLRLGETSTTGDPEGEISRLSDKVPSETEVEAVLDQFKGQVTQVPPVFSAVKIGGQRAYKLARAGKEVAMKPRTVEIYSITEVRYHYTELSFTAYVSCGTYIRSLATDIGKYLGTGAYLTSLRRTRIEEYGVDKALSLDKIDYNVIINNVKQIPPN